MTELSILNDIHERLAALTPVHYDWAERQLERKVADDDKVIGEVTNPAMRGLWVLSAHLKTMSELENAKSAAALDTITSEESAQQSAILSTLGGVARELFFAQAYVDLGFYKIGSTALRSGYVLIEIDGPRNAFPFPFPFPVG